MPLAVADATLARPWHKPPINAEGQSERQRPIGTSLIFSIGLWCTRKVFCKGIGILSISLFSHLYYTCLPLWVLILWTPSLVYLPCDMCHITYGPSSLVTCHCHMVTQAYHYGCASIWPSSASWSVWLTASWWYDSARLCSYQYISRATLYIR